MRVYHRRIFLFKYLALAVALALIDCGGIGRSAVKIEVWMRLARELPEARFDLWFGGVAWKTQYDIRRAGNPLRASAAD